MSFRKERKFRLTACDASSLRVQLVGKGMLLLHPDRKIASQYFDTANLKLFEESEEGVLPRTKIRVRWYNDDQDKLALERKVSSIEGRFKTTKEITSQYFKRIRREGIWDPAYGRMTPSVVISYARSYFAYKDMRITFDTDIRYAFGLCMQYRDFEEVVEIKAPFDTPDDYLERLLPIPTSRFSKYGRSFLRRERLV